LVVADGHIADLIRQALEQRGFDIGATDNFANAHQKLFESQLDLVLIDLELAEAADFIRQVRNISSLSRTSVLAIGKWGSGQPTIALGAGADAYEPAPIDPERLIDAVERVLHKRAAVVGMNE
jgi:DNA-binding response OmpR family regulator